jgi:hypothetical protein
MTEPLLLAERNRQLEDLAVELVTCAGGKDLNGNGRCS